jgi:hypothetical protein
MKKSKVTKRKMAEAKKRTELRAERTDEQQIQKLDAEGQNATKERKRLQQRISVQKRIKIQKKIDDII